jgi:16S rRNA G527 N7-methylase RsmG
MSKNILFAAILIMTVVMSNGKAPVELEIFDSNGKRMSFLDIVPQELYGKKGNFLLCFKCRTCKNKKFQRLYLRGHLGRLKQ